MDGVIVDAGQHVRARQVSGLTSLRLVVVISVAMTPRRGRRRTGICARMQIRAAALLCLDRLVPVDTGGSRAQFSSLLKHSHLKMQ